MRISITYVKNNRKIPININKKDKIYTIKEKINKMLNIPIIKQKIIIGNDELDDNETIEYYNIDMLTNIKLDIVIGAFGIIKKPPIDINTFIIDNTYSYYNEIIVFIWGNYINYNRKLKETKTVKDMYTNWHDIFRQQLPIPIIEKTYIENKDISIYLVDSGFAKINEYDIRLIFNNITEPIIIENIELYSIPINILFEEIGLPYIDNNINNSVINIYILPYYYGFCNTNYSNTETNIKLCLNELQQSLNDVVEEYYIYGQPLDIDELITNKEAQSFKTWYKKGGNYNKKRNKKTRNKRRILNTRNIFPF
jgi:hypothetical protein